MSQKASVKAEIERLKLGKGQRSEQTNGINYEPFGLKGTWYNLPTAPRAGTRLFVSTTASALLVYVPTLTEVIDGNVYMLSDDNGNVSKESYGAQLEDKKALEFLANLKPIEQG